MALYHFHVEQIKRSEGRTAVASAAYRAGEIDGYLVRSRLFHRRGERNLCVCQGR